LNHSEHSGEEIFHFRNYASHFVFPEPQKTNKLILTIVQVFYTLSCSYGGLLTYASFNKFNAPILRDAALLSILSCVFSVFCGFIVFPYIGYLSHLTGEPISHVIQPGQGLAFIVFPYAVGTLKGGPFWSICFFVSMLIIGMDNMMASVETLNAAITDLFPAIKKTRIRGFTIKAVICLCFFLVGLLFCSRSGIYWVNFFNQFSGSMIFKLKFFFII
jgi:SNF family Na+-dependent transporter